MRRHERILGKRECEQPADREKPLLRVRGNPPHAVRHDAIVCGYVAGGECRKRLQGECTSIEWGLEPSAFLVNAGLARSLHFEAALRKDHEVAMALVIMGRR
jgi:hypothetical protein